RFYFIIATTLFIECTLLISIILLSITLRLDPKHIKNGFLLYLPVLCTGTILIFYRIMLVSNIMLSFTLPIILVISAIAQLFVLLKYEKGALRSDMFYGWLSFAITTASVLLSWIGYNFLALQLMMFLMVFLTGIQAVICLRHLLGLDKANHLKKVHNIKKTWFKTLMNMLVFPTLCLIVFVGSILWAAHVFSMAPWVMEQMRLYFINLPNVAMVSFEKVIWLVIIAFAFNYLIYFVKEILRSVFADSFDSGIIPVCVTVGTIVIWGLYIIIVIFMLNINNNGLIAAVGGMSMGIGFALKDTIDNLFCGFSLMLGRVRPGDMVECDGIRGRITNIGMRSTTLEAVDGSIIAFLNNQLFTKNFKNLTKNHNYETAQIAVGIAYGDDVDKAREIILQCIKEVEGLAPSRAASVILNQFGASSVDLIVTVWAPVDAKGKVLSAIREKIYKSFAKEGISIPFPQQDIYVHSIPKEKE
ncbi:MAG: mechanosensitive ion channel, partial [Bacteroidales bacterium]